MTPVGDLASVASAVVGGIGLLLNELRLRRTTGDLDNDELREVLLVLEQRLAVWLARAVETDRWFGELAEAYYGPYEIRQRVSVRALLSGKSNISAGRAVSMTLRHGLDHLRRGRRQSPSLEAFLRTYSPELADTSAVFTSRLEAVTLALNQVTLANEPPSQGAIELAELERTREMLVDVAAQLRVFIRESFPLT